MKAEGRGKAMLWWKLERRGRTVAEGEGNAMLCDGIHHNPHQQRALDLKRCLGRRVSAEFILSVV
jgi:hypothetical protein